MNQYDIIRKYVCSDCAEVMMCDCEEQFATRFLPHQVHEGHDTLDARRIPVTLGFQSNICNECRGLEQEPFPKAEMFGSTSKIKRYYWRELIKRELELFGEWAFANGEDPLFAESPSASAARKDAGRRALDEIKKLHETKPKYRYQKETSLQDLKRDYGLEIVELKGVYVSMPQQKRVALKLNDEFVGVEKFVEDHYQQQGFCAITLESRPLHVFFAVLMWELIQDLDDERVRIIGFGDRISYDEGRQGAAVYCRLPEDFGKPGYATRRRIAIERHLDRLEKDDDWEWLFNYWLEPSERLRQYLWAHRKEDVEAARKLVSVLPRDVLLRIIRFLIDAYWDRYLGWPDLLFYQNEEYFFAEVKSAGDELSANQKQWIQLNSQHLKLPVRLVKVLRSDSSD